jgi:cytochrome c-type biogenesis protein CcmH
MVLVPVLVAALVVGAGRDQGPPTVAQRVQRISEKVRCPTCESQSVADSKAPASEAIRQEVHRRVAAGQTEAEVLDFLVSRYGKEVVLEPEARGVGAVVWFLPLLAVTGAIAGLALALARWRSRPPPEVALEDRLLVEEARRG